MSHHDSKGKKAEHTFSAEEAVSYLRRLADQLENGAIQVEHEEMEFEGLVSVKESLKSKKGKTSVKVKLKLTTHEMPSPESEPAAPAEPGAEAAPEEEEPDDGEEPPSSYKKLKKRMGKQFKAMGQALEEGNLPEAAEVETFCDLCQHMTGFTDADQGPEMYPQFLEQAQALRAAGASGDLEALRAAHADLAATKKVCHKQYK